MFVFHTLCRPDVVVTVFTLLLSCCSCSDQPDLLSCVLNEGFSEGQFFSNTVLFLEGVGGGLGEGGRGSGF